ncbi:hypothetical protein [Natronobacterium gregoryi]|uniref:hypothetical protein n=1 Tax=Natronobacterium gregoryi TaxID=44930 RepID=UPI001E5204DF|nr:hypothetical protein [Natronobacterium gregoryi]
MATTDTVPSLGPVQVTFNGEEASRASLELEELLNSLKIGPLAIADAPHAGLEGYYWSPSISRDMRTSGEQGIVTLDPSFALAGRRGSHRRAIETAPSDDVDHEYGNDLEALIALPATARLAEWLDPESKTTDPATPLETVETARGELELYDAKDGPDLDTTQPVLTADIPYSDDSIGDVYVWDLYDSDEVAEGRRVSLPAHDPAGPIALDTGRLRLVLDQYSGTIQADEYDPDNGWSDVGLEDDQPASVELVVVDVATIEAPRARGQLRFDVDGDPYYLDVIASGGHDSVLVTIPDGESGPIPTSLEEWLEPIASERIVDPQSSKTLVDRQEVRR